MSSTEVRFLQRIAGAKLEDDFSHVSEAGVFAAAYQEQDGMLPTTLRLVGEMSGGRAPTAVADYAPPPQGAVLGQETARLTRYTSRLLIGGPGNCLGHLLDYLVLKEEQGHLAAPLLKGPLVSLGLLANHVRSTHLPHQKIFLREHIKLQNGDRSWRPISVAQFFFWPQTFHTISFICQAKMA